jgi:tetratricopeptide (TPR) repeat protein
MRVYVSSTAEDLRDQFRPAVLAAIRRLEHLPVCMEDYHADDRRPLDKCLADLATCDALVLIVAWRYGYIPDGQDASITEREYREACARGIPTLIYLLHEDAPWIMRLVDDGLRGERRIDRWRGDLERAKTRALFKTPDELGALVSAGLHQVEAHQRRGQIAAAGAAAADARPAAAPEVFVAQLPGTRSKLYGRAAELEALDQAWDGAGRRHLATIVAWGGVGKSAVVNSWLARMAAHAYRGAEAVFGWCFYEGPSAASESSADVFAASALRCFGDPDPTLGSPWEKGLRLARLVRARRTLLVLDGLEAVQHSHGPDQGKLRDYAVAALLRQLAGQNPGLCVIATRLPVVDLEPFLDTTVVELRLDQLGESAGVELLTDLGVRGAPGELAQAVAEYRGHALSLTLLGSYLAAAHDGDVTRRHEVGRGQEHDQARQVMESYEHWLGAGPEVDILRVLGAFSRPAPSDGLQAVRRQPVIPGLTDNLTALSREKWNLAVSRLRALKLIAERNPERPDVLDTHPLVRQHFAAQLRAGWPEAWRQVNDRLYEYYRALPASQLPDTLDEMSYLFHAVAHGCLAGRQQEAWDRVYWPRIRRGTEGYSVLRLSAYGSDLATAAHFFEECWDRPCAALDEEAAANLQTETGFTLRGLGRLEEAVELFERGLAANRAAGRLQLAADAAGNLSEIQLVLGRIDEAIRTAELSLRLALKLDDPALLASNRATLADALYQRGRGAEAEREFAAADAHYQEQMRPTRALHQLIPYHFCSLLIDRGREEEALERALASLPEEERFGRHHRVGLANLWAANAAAAIAGRQGTQADDRALALMSTALEHLRLSGHQDLVVRGLLASAALRRVGGDLEVAQVELDEAAAAALRGQMNLHVADAHLEQARLHLRRGASERARGTLAQARERANAMKYGRRAAEIAALERVLGERQS